MNASQVFLRIAVVIIDKLRRCRVPDKRLSEIKIAKSELSERDARYFPNDPELVIVIPHLVGYFKHPLRTRDLSDEIGRTVMQVVEVKRTKWTRRQVRIWFRNSQRRYLPVRVGDKITS
jgi:hypothetical protein